MWRFWRKPRITADDEARRRQVVQDLGRLRASRDRGLNISRHSRRIRQENHFSKAIFGGPRE